MDTGIRVGHFEPDSGDVNLPIGFIPDFLLLVEVGEGTNPNLIVWFERQEDDEAGGSQEGTLLTGSSGVTTLISDSQGITAYDTGLQLPEAGAGAGQLAQWVADTAMVVRTALAAGTYAKPTVGATDDTGGIADREAIFECVAGSGDLKTHATTEPIWPSAIGGQVVDDLVTWEKVNTPTFRGGYQGVTIANESTNNGQEMYYLAIRAHDSVDHGDVDGWPSGVDTDWR